MRQAIDIDTASHIKEVLEKDDNVVFALLFGSYAKGKQRKDSDIDIAVYFKEKPDADAFLRYVCTFSDIINKEVDVVILNKASAMLRHQIFKNKQTLVVKDKEQYINFRLKSMNDYEEYKHISGLDVYDR
jgi:predicted nucleotidyltransferase